MDERDFGLTDQAQEVRAILRGHPMRDVLARSPDHPEWERIEGLSPPMEVSLIRAAILKTMRREDEPHSVFRRK